MFSKVISTNTSPSPKHNLSWIYLCPLFNMHIDQGERHRLLRASSLLCCLYYYLIVYLFYILAMALSVYFRFMSLTIPLVSFAPITFVARILSHFLAHSISSLRINLYLSFTCFLIWVVYWLLIWVNWCLYLQLLIFQDGDWRKLGKTALFRVL